jgi:ubiquinone/menaquinone biosynthesis C-methylase UbiE
MCDLATALFWSLITIATILFFWNVVFRLIKRYHSTATPGFMTRLLDNPIRRIIQKPKTIIKRLGLKPGMKMLEIGPGKGNYTREFAKAVLPGGKVYAVDIQESVVEYLKKKVEKENITNLIPQTGDVYNLKFEDNTFDVVFGMTVLPEIGDPVRALKEIRRIVKTGGIVSFVEAFPDPDYPRRNTEKKWAKEAGLKFVQQHGNWFIYQLNFQK